MKQIESLFEMLSGFLWGYPLLILILGGGLFFLFYSQFVPYKYFLHSLKIISGKYDDPDESGYINHFQALSTALAATVGMGNVGGVAVAITMGGPGAIFWMWVSAIVGMSTKFFTCTLSVMYRGYDSAGKLQGGPMYFIIEGLGKKWKPMAVFFSFCAMFAVLPMFQANQLNQVIRDMVLIPNNLYSGVGTDVMIGVLISILMAAVIFGGIKRIGKIAGRLVPLMVVIYFLLVIYILFTFRENLIPSIKLIFSDAFSAKSVMGGALGALIITGIKRGAFSNEAGMGTAPLAHGAAKTNEPVREGLVAMTGPFIDTIIVCTMTALAIIVTGVWQDSTADGITLTALAFNEGIPVIGPYILIFCVTIFAITTMFTFPYYGEKCFSFLFGVKYKNIYLSVSILSAIIASVVSIDVVVNFIDSTYALMAFPTILSAILLSPNVRKASRSYFTRLKKEN